MTWNASVCMCRRENGLCELLVTWRSSWNVDRASSSTDARLGAESSEAAVDCSLLSSELCQFTSWRRSAGSSCSLRPSESACCTTCSMISRSVDCSANVDSSTWTRIEGRAAASICDTRVRALGPNHNNDNDNNYHNNQLCPTTALTMHWKYARASDSCLMLDYEFFF